MYEFLRHNLNLLTVLSHLITWAEYLTAESSQGKTRMESTLAQLLGGLQVGER